MQVVKKATHVRYENRIKDNIMYVFREKMDKDEREKKDNHPFRKEKKNTLTRS